MLCRRNMRVAIAGALVLAPSLALAQGDAKAPRVALADAVKRAMDRNPTVALALADIRHADALVREARSTSFPTLVGTGTYTRLDSDRKSNNVVIAAQDQLSANVLLTVPIIHPKAWSQWKHAEDNADATRATLADVKRQMGLAVGHAYLQIIAQRRLVEVSERARDAAKAHYEFAHSRFAGGVGNRLDEVRAAQEVATDDSQLAAAQGGLIRAREALGVLLGVDGPLDAADDPALGDPPQLATALEDARKRSDVVAQQARVTAADRVVRDNWKDYSPYLVALGQPFYQNPPTLTTPQTGWQAQLVLTLPLYDGGLRYGQAQERDALADQAKIQLDATLRQARSEVRTAFDVMKKNDDALKSARDAAALAKEALDLAIIAYRGGATTNLEVTDAERRARDAETAAAIAEDASRTARLELLVASGRFP
jgi:outer membrane protein TolC